MAEAWTSTQRPCSPVSSVEDRAQGLHTALVTAVKTVSKSGVSKRWVQCGRGVAHHAGGAPVLRHLGVIVAVRAGRPGMKFRKWETEDGVSDDSDNEVQGHDTTAWKFGPVKKSLTILERFIRGWDALVCTFRHAPRSCGDWADKVPMEYFLTVI